MAAGNSVSPLLAALMFILLSPGLIVTLPPDGGAIWQSETTSNLAILVHAVIYFMALQMVTTWTGQPYDAIHNIFNVFNKPNATENMSPIIATLFFILLSPGLIFTLPAVDGKMFMGENTNVLAIVVHGVLFFIINTLVQQGGGFLGVFDYVKQAENTVTEQTNL